MTPLLLRLELSHLDDFVAAHAIVRTLQPLVTDSPLRSRPGIYTLGGTINTLGISLGTWGNLPGLPGPITHGPFCCNRGPSAVTRLSAGRFAPPPSPFPILWGRDGWGTTNRH